VCKTKGGLCAQSAYVVSSYTFPVQAVMAAGVIVQPLPATVRVIQVWTGARYVPTRLVKVMCMSSCVSFPRPTGQIHSKAASAEA
jgi:hypothetical protein